jgi:apolipoprotein N-acyltransferase
VAALLLAVRGRSAVVAAGLGLPFGLAFFLPVLHWSGVYVGVLPWAALATLEALYITVMAGCCRGPGGRPGGGRHHAGRGRPVGGCGGSARQDAVRRLPLGTAGVLPGEAPSLGLAALGGAPLLTAVVAASRRAAGLRRRRDRHRGPRTAAGRVACPVRRAAPAVAMLAVAVALILAGLAVPATRGGRAGVQVAAVQGNVPRPGLEFNAERRAVLDNHVAATLALAQRVSRGEAPQPDLVLWPENSSDIDPLRNPTPPP